MMKRTKQSTLWYNARNKELNAILLEHQETIARYGDPVPGPMAGPWMPDVYPGFRIN